MEVTVVIPNYNGKEFLGPCLDSLCNQSVSEYKLIVVDNGSQDNSVEFIKEKYPKVHLIELEKNVGFSAAVNIGIKSARTQFVVLMNSDTVAETFWLETLYNCIAAQPQVFSCSSRMIQMRDPLLIDNAGDQFTIIGWAFQRGHGLSVSKYNQSSKIFSSCGGAAIYRTEVFEKIGYFDEGFFAYLEDVEIGYRARLNGYQNIYCSDAQIYHFGSATSGSKYNEFKVRLTGRNTVYMLCKLMPRLQIILNLPFIIIGILLMGWNMKRNSLNKAYYEGIKEGLRNRNRQPVYKSSLIQVLKIQWNLYYNLLEFGLQFLQKWQASRNQ
ncbi:glycosyltransferase family 2 protein [Cohnella hashimotonis]|uniref:Glycosyltransferase family 2 protein n=1 Tax=Cohnella hashimotonis TaxID=2826895 RepID=A0ABT6TTV2_9BACL|nr:glycosyltransferase family 2 protein [Cohnella hashimotonis]MDI4650293.1 glycosyltransferase family 2 protein [Cohnella hashimotonis]